MKLTNRETMQRALGIIELLKSYSTCKKFLYSQGYAKEYFDADDTQDSATIKQYEARINVIESLIKLLAPSDEYTLLDLHYIKGIPVEKCAEAMQVSRRTAFRMLKKAHKTIYDTVSEYERSRQ